VLLSIIIPVFNRQDVVCRSIASAIACFGQAGKPFEIIVVDDGSQDGSLEAVRQHFPEDLDKGRVRLFKMPRNQGVSKARNHGASHAQGNWLMFLDSDDHLIASAHHGVITTLERHGTCPVVFFRCIDENGTFVGLPFKDEVVLDLVSYAQNATYGEAMAVVRRDTVDGRPVFDETLIGYEGLSLLRLIARHGSAVLSPVVARVYDRTRQDRLSTFKGMMKRADTLARGHRLLVSEFGQTMSRWQATKFQLKALVYRLMAAGHRIGQWGRASHP
jgi:glycosyltransferase involved in cell wall biosynthesis